MKTTTTTRKAVEQSRGVSKRQANRIIQSGPALASAKLAKEQATAKLRQAQAEREKLELQRARGLVVPRSEVDAEGLALGMAVKAQLLAWSGALPGKLEGLTASAMSEVLSREVKIVLHSLATLKISGQPVQTEAKP